MKKTGAPWPTRSHFLNSEFGILIFAIPWPNRLLHQRALPPHPILQTNQRLAHRHVPARAVHRLAAAHRHELKAMKSRGGRVALAQLQDLPPDPPPRPAWIDEHRAD